MLEEAYRRAVAGGGRAAHLLCSPHNPTGTVHTAQELSAVAALAGRYGVRVVADEIHAPLAAPGVDFVPYLAVPGAESGLSLMSASKAWNLAGLKAALAVAGPAAGADLALLPEEVSHGPSHVGVLAHTAALREGTVWLDALLVAWTTTGACSPPSWPSISPASGTGRARRPTSPGSTAGRWASVTIRPRSSWSAAGWPSAPGRTSARAAPGTSV